ncbi:MAG: hypothetical protein ACLS29_02245 [Prevotellamassilia sp.]
MLRYGRSTVVYRSGDTVVFNPQAFRLAEGARLNELISKLPGVTEKDGSLQWMGKPIRILMEGRNCLVTPHS